MSLNLRLITQSKILFGLMDACAYLGDDVSFDTTYNTNNMVLEIISGFQHVYTREKFRKVQAHFRGKVNYITRLTESILGFTAYEVVEQVSNSKFNKFVVTYDAISHESSGILCHHFLSVLSFGRMDKVASRYILERWSENIKRGQTHIKSSHNEPLLEPRNRRFDDLVFRSHNICKFVSGSKELTMILYRVYDNAMVEMQE
ncbi:hypothetical protein Ahy_A04g020313 [Arachis hypogaea]|uniref:Protein FAR1-RELATED SEQUENCE n=1 Tax=Arachis hypogaea TaxID=3818 RepID=A0A445DHF3_ARAHY|nr:hypothetical protein Ahy_A04g020313 [Arachis hypogaea]